MREIRVGHRRLERDVPALGRQALIHEMRANQVKGNLVLSRRWYLAERLGASALSQVMYALPDDARKLLENQVMPFFWYDFGLLLDVDLAIIDLTMSGSSERMFGFGLVLGAHDVGTVYRVFLSIASPAFVLKKVAALGSLYFKESTLSFTPAERQAGRVELVGRCMPRYMCHFGISGWLTAVLEAANARNVAVEHTRCVHSGAERCQWQCRWDE